MRVRNTGGDESETGLRQAIIKDSSFWGPFQRDQEEFQEHTDFKIQMIKLHLGSSLVVCRIPFPNFGESVT